MTGDNAGSLTRSALFLMILACCLLLANLYYAQPVLADIARELRISASLAGVVITMSQFGYIAGLLLLAPLGDFVENRKLCATMTAEAACCALISCLARSAPIFLCAVFLMGVFASATQTLVVFAVSLAGSRKSGKILGIMACGIFLGIAASRPISSFLASL